MSIACAIKRPKVWLCYLLQEDAGSPKAVPRYMSSVHSDQAPSQVIYIAAWKLLPPPPFVVCVLNQHHLGSASFYLLIFWVQVVLDPQILVSLPGNSSKSEITSSVLETGIRVPGTWGQTQDRNKSDPSADTELNCSINFLRLFSQHSWFGGCTVTHPCLAEWSSTSDPIFPGMQREFAESMAPLATTEIRRVNPFLLASNWSKGELNPQPF